MIASRDGKKSLWTDGLTSCQTCLYCGKPKGPGVHRARLILAIGLAATVLIAGLGASNPQNGEQTCRYFNETGHWVCGEFLEFFDARGGLEIFGYPLTEAFDDATRGDLHVQYFQRARLEWHPDNSAPYRVQLGLLVDELGYGSPPAQPEEVPSSNGPLHHYFPQTQHVVSYGFLDYFREHGGLDIFGYPRSDLMYEGERIVQYFQRARMVWHPESPAGSQVRLADLGEIYIEEFGLPGDYDEPVPPSARPREDAYGDRAVSEAARTVERMVTKLRATASVRSIITGRQGKQTLFVYVTDQQKRPLEGVSVTADVRYPSRRQTFELGLTDEDGFVRKDFEILPTPPGKRVVIDISVVYQDVAATTQIFFLPWW